MVCLVAPFILQAAVNYWTVRSFWDSHNSSLGRASFSPHKVFRALTDAYLESSTFLYRASQLSWLLRSQVQSLRSRRLLWVDHDQACPILPLPSSHRLTAMSDLLDRCQPPPGLSDPEYKLFDSSICTQTNLRIMRDGFRSFPSGHSSSMCVMCYMYLGTDCQCFSVICWTWLLCVLPRGESSSFRSTWNSCKLYQAAGSSLQ